MNKILPTKLVLPIEIKKLQNFTIVMHSLCCIDYAAKIVNHYHQRSDLKFALLFELAIT